MFARRPTYQLSPDPAPAGGAPATPPAPAAGDQPADPPGRSNDPAVLSARLDKSIEAEKAARDRAQKAEAEAQRLAALEADRQKKLLEEQGKHKELYEAAEKERTSLAEKVAAYETVQRARADAALAQIPEHLRAFAPADPVKAEEYAAAVLKSSTPAPGAPTPPRPTTAQAAPPAPNHSSAAAPEAPTVSERVRLANMESFKKTHLPEYAVLKARIDAYDRRSRS